MEESGRRNLEDNKMRDHEDANFVHHEVKKVWKGIVSVGSYTFDKCIKKHKGLILYFQRRTMTIPYESLNTKSFHLHQQTIESKFGEPYIMYDFGWTPDKKRVSLTPSAEPHGL